MSQPLLATQSAEQGGEISPDGKWMAYESDESGRIEVYVRPFPEVQRGRWQISSGGGSRPVWARSGQELFFISGRALIQMVERAASAAIVAVPVQTDPSFVAGNPVTLFPFAGRYFSGSSGRTYDVSPDGSRFLMVKLLQSSAETVAASRLILVEHWSDELKRLVPLN